MKTKNCKDGCYLGGTRSHKKGGIPVIVTDQDKMVEVESSEIIIKGDAVNNQDVHTFDGKKMTNAEVLNKINVDAGGNTIYATTGTDKYSNGGGLKDKKIHLLSKAGHEEEIKRRLTPFLEYWKINPKDKSTFPPELINKFKNGIGEMYNNGFESFLEISTGRATCRFSGKKIPKGNLELILLLGNSSYELTKYHIDVITIYATTGTDKFHNGGGLGYNKIVETIETYKEMLKEAKTKAEKEKCQNTIDTYTEILAELKTQKLDDGGNMSVQFIDYNGHQIMFEPHYKEYFVNDEQFETIEDAKKYIDNGLKLSNKTINAYRHGVMAEGGNMDEPEPLQPAPYSVIKSKHTKTGKDIWIVRMVNRFDSSTYKAIESKIKQNGGFWSGFVKGFLFNVEPNPDILDNIFGVATIHAQVNESVPQSQRGLITFNEANRYETVNRGILKKEWEAGKMVAAGYKHFDGMQDMDVYTPDSELVYVSKGENEWIDQSLDSDFSSSYESARSNYDSKTITIGSYYLKYKPEIIITDIKKPSGLFSYNYYVNVDKKVERTEKPDFENQSKNFGIANGTKVKIEHAGKYYCGEVISNRENTVSITSWSGGSEREVKKETTVHYKIRLDNGLTMDIDRFQISDSCVEIEQPLLIRNGKIDWPESVWYDITYAITGRLTGLKRQLAARKLEKYRVQDKKYIAEYEAKLFKDMALFLAWEQTAPLFVESITGETESEQEQRRKLWSEKLNIQPDKTAIYIANIEKAKIEEVEDSLSKYLIAFNPLVKKYNLEKADNLTTRFYMYADTEKRFALKIDIGSDGIKTVLIVLMAAKIEEKTFTDITELENYLIELKGRYANYWIETPEDLKNKVSLPFATTRGSRYIGLYELSKNNMLAIDQILEQQPAKTSIVIIAKKLKGKDHSGWIEIYQSESEHSSWLTGKTLMRTVKFFDQAGSLLDKTTFTSYRGTFGIGLESFFWSEGWKYWAKEKASAKGYEIQPKGTLFGEYIEPESQNEVLSVIPKTYPDIVLNKGDVYWDSRYNDYYLIESIIAGNEERNAMVTIAYAKGYKDKTNKVLTVSDTSIAYDISNKQNSLAVNKDEILKEYFIEKQPETGIASETISYPNQSEQDLIDLAFEMGERSNKNDGSRAPAQSKEFMDFFFQKGEDNKNVSEYMKAYINGFDSVNSANAKKILEENKPEVKLYPFIAFYKGKQHELYAETKLKAQTEAAKFFKAKNSWDVSVHIAQEDEKPAPKTDAEIIRHVLDTIKPVSVDDSDKKGDFDELADFLNDKPEVKTFKGFSVGETVKTDLNENIYTLLSFQNTNKALQEKAVLKPVKTFVAGKEIEPSKDNFVVDVDALVKYTEPKEALILSFNTKEQAKDFHKLALDKFGGSNFSLKVLGEHENFGIQDKYYAENNTDISEIENLYDKFIDSLEKPQPKQPESIKYRAEVAGTNENIWSGNAIEYDTVKDAQDYLTKLSSKWFGYDLSRVVPATTPDRQKVDFENDVFFQIFRKGVTGKKETEQPAEKAIEPEASKPELTKEAAEKLLKGFEIQQKYKPTEQLAKRIAGMKIFIKYKK